MKQAVVALLLVLSCRLALAADPEFQVVKPPQPTSDPSKIVVTEFFSYQCPHCSVFAKPFAAWAKTLPPDVKVERVAVSIGHAQWAPMAQAFYTLTAMKVVDSVDEGLFKAIHEDGVKLETEGSIANWLGQHGVDKAEFTRLYPSFSVQMHTSRADTISREHRIPSVPTLVIDGKYLVAIADNGHFEDQLAVAHKLIDRVRRER